MDSRRGATPSTSIGSSSSKDVRMGSNGGGDCARLGGLACVSSRHFATLSCTAAGSLLGIRGSVSSCSSDWLVGTSSSGSAVKAELDGNGVRSDSGEECRIFLGGDRSLFPVRPCYTRARIFTIQGTHYCCVSSQVIPMHGAPLLRSYLLLVLERTCVSEKAFSPESG